MPTLFYNNIYGVRSVQEQVKLGPKQTKRIHRSIKKD